ncbi:MAG TPA: extracellular solute-binding protein [Candidatus Moranbacteria bacterium]|nr:extracellular solute-binding protein [Candidatus Moranbacteria bacterium]
MRLRFERFEKLKKFQNRPMWKKTRKFFVLTILFLAVPVLSGCVKKAPQSYTVNLEVWGVFDDSADYNDIFRAYAKVNPYVNSITFRKFTIEEYRRELLNALASGKGPDIFMVNNAWLPDYYDKITPAPENLINKQMFSKVFVDVAAEDNIVADQVIGVPLSVDALALYYNKDIFAAAGIVSPPQTWEEFNSTVEKLTKIDSYGNIVRSGAAMGTAKNINRSTDILTLLMMQSGVEMTDKDGQRITWTGATAAGAAGTVPAAVRALEYYTDFANPTKAVYTWNPRRHYSIDSFVAGDTAMMINYSWHYGTIARRNEKLRFGVSKVPQIDPEKPVNVANYWTFVVSRNKETPSPTGVAVNNRLRVHEAWQFLKYMTMVGKGNFTLVNGLDNTAQTVFSEIDPAADYLAKTGKPAARKDLVNKQLTDPILEPFAYGVLNARSWRRKNSEEIERVMAEMIEDVVRGRADAQRAFWTATTRAGQLLK